MPKGKILMGKKTPKPVPGGKPTPGKQLPKRGPVKPRTPKERKFIEEQLRENPRRAVPKGGMVNPKRKNLTGSTLKAKQAATSYLSNSAAKPKGKSSAQFPRGMDWAGSPIRPGVDKMSPTGTTTGSLKWRDRKSTQTQGVGSTNAGRAYGKGVDARNAELGKRPMGEYLKKPKQRGKVSGPDAIVGKGKQPKKNLFGR